MNEYAKFVMDSSVARIEESKTIEDVNDFISAHMSSLVLAISHLNAKLENKERMLELLHEKMLDMVRTHVPKQHPEAH